MSYACTVWRRARNAVTRIGEPSRTHHFHRRLLKLQHGGLQAYASDAEKIPARARIQSAHGVSQLARPPPAINQDLAHYQRIIPHLSSRR